MIKVVFVCLGNICCSPMAEVIFRSMVEMQGLADQIQIDSAATSNWEAGNPVHPGARQQLAQVHLSADGLRSRPLGQEDQDAQFIIGMDDQNIKDIYQIMSGQTSAHISKLLYFTSEARDIADPYYTGDFDQAFADIFAGCQALLEYISNQDYFLKHGLPLKGR